MLKIANVVRKTTTVTDCDIEMLNADGFSASEYDSLTSSLSDDELIPQKNIVGCRESHGLTARFVSLLTTRLLFFYTMVVSHGIKPWIYVVLSPYSNL